MVTASSELERKQLQEEEHALPDAHACPTMSHTTCSSLRAASAHRSPIGRLSILVQSSLCRERCGCHQQGCVLQSALLGCPGLSVQRAQVGAFGAVRVLAQEWAACWSSWGGVGGCGNWSVMAQYCSAGRLEQEAEDFWEAGIYPVWVLGSWCSPVGQEEEVVTQ